MDVNDTPGAAAAVATAPDAGARTETDAADRAPRADWPLAIGLSVLLGLAFRLTAGGSSFPPTLPLYAWAPMTGVAILLYLGFARVGRGSAAAPAGAVAPAPARIAWAALVLAAFALHARTFAPPARGDLAVLAAIHLPALVWIVLDVVVLGSASDASERFAALVKSVEAMVTGALYAGVALLFTLVTLGLFRTLRVDLPEPVARTFASFLPGLVPVLAVASVYDPGLRPGEQHAGAGVTRVFFVAARLFLAPTLAVLLVVAAVMPARFAVLAGNRETLVAFNVMLFAVMVLLVGAAPARNTAPADRLEPWLRRGIVAVATLTVIVSGYALAAILSRTVPGGLTANRATVIGWNVVNLATLVTLLVLQLRARRDAWVPALHRACGLGLALYGVWTVLVLVALPLVARVAGWPVGTAFFGRGPR